MNDLRLITNIKLDDELTFNAIENSYCELIRMHFNHKPEQAFNLFVAEWRGDIDVQEMNRLIKLSIPEIKHFIDKSPVLLYFKNVYTHNDCDIIKDDQFIINLMLQGSGEVSLHDKKGNIYKSIKVNKGDLFILDGNIEHSFKIDEPDVIAVSYNVIIKI